MISDYWSISDKNLYHEIRVPEDKVSTEVWDALDSTREIGNIGAHMQADINVILDIEPDEAKLSIKLIL